MLSSLLVSALLAATPATATPAGSFVGHWTLNAGKSEDARQKMRDARGGSSGGGGEPGGRHGGGGMGGRSGGGGHWGGGQGGPGGGGSRGQGEGARPAAMEALFEPATELTIQASENGIDLVPSNQSIRSLHPDGKKYKADAGSTEVTSRFDGTALVVESKTAHGSKLVETFRVDEAQHQLVVVAQMEGGRGPAISVTRVYDADAAPQP